MASNQCIIDDDYFIQMGNYFKNQGDELDRMVSEYIRYLTIAKTLGVKKGEVREALEEYIVFAQKLKDQIGDISTYAQSQVASCLTKVDEADQYLF